MRWSFRFFLSFVSFLSSLIPAFAADYHEQLVLRPLPLSSLLASFNFRSNTSLSDFEAHNFRLFPRSLGQILQYSDTRELHLRFGLGRWDAESWGARPWAGAREGGTGVELWAWLDADTDEEYGCRTSGTSSAEILTLVQGGPEMAHIDERIVGPLLRITELYRRYQNNSPGHDLPARRRPYAHDSKNTHLLYGTLPHEVVCTENLTPFLKLLPCKGKVGIASLLDGHKLFDASWQNMAIDVRPVCPEGGECVLEIEQTIDMVLDVERSKRPRDNPIPRPPPGHELKCDTSKPYHSGDTCFPADLHSYHDWSLSQIFGKPMKGICPLADRDVGPVCLEVPNTRTVYVSSGVFERKNADDRSRCFIVEPDATLEMIMPYEEPQGDETQTQNAKQLVELEKPQLYAERSFTGHGQERGGVQAILTNPSPDSEVEFLYMESLPWFMRVYLHTLEARIDGHVGKHDNLVEEVYYRPAVDRARGTQLELRMRIPPASTVFLTYDFEKTILRYTEYPPDANRGFDVAAAVITILNPANSSSSLQEKSGPRYATYNLRTTTLLLSLPTPDFSMPYNVIIFTSTAIALAFGGLFNILVRRFVAADEGPEFSLNVIARRLAGRAKALVDRIGKKSSSPKPSGKS